MLKETFKGVKIIFILIFYFSFLMFYRISAASVRSRDTCRQAVTSSHVTAGLIERRVHFLFTSSDTGKHGLLSDGSPESAALLRQVSASSSGRQTQTEWASPPGGEQKDRRDTFSRRRSFRSPFGVKDSDDSDV